MLRISWGLQAATGMALYRRPGDNSGTPFGFPVPRRPAIILGLLPIAVRAGRPMAVSACRVTLLSPDSRSVPFASDGCSRFVGPFSPESSLRSP